jgi:hypothetical protein
MRPRTRMPTEVSPTGFETGHAGPEPALGGSCAQCGASRAATIRAFHGGALCALCAHQRDQLASLLSALVRGATPEEMLAGCCEAPLDELERVEMRDAADVLLTAQRLPLGAAR